MFENASPFAEFLSVHRGNDLLQPAAALLLFLGAAGVVVIVALRAVRFQAWLWRLRSVLVAGLLLLAVQVILYFSVFNRCEEVRAARDGSAVLLLGRIESLHWFDNRFGEVVFILADPTGWVSVVSTNGPAAVGSLCLVKGRKATAISGLPVVVCDFRLSSPGHEQAGTR